jgi:predicted nuclease of predicted toxin-antitoxin system
VKFKTDENLPVEAAATLREFGFDAETVWDEDLSGADDRVIAARTQSEGRILLTLDLDFANIHAYPPDQHAGIIVHGSRTQDKVTVVAYVRRIAAQVPATLWAVFRRRSKCDQNLGETPRLAPLTDDAPAADTAGFPASAVADSSLH